MKLYCLTFFICLVLIILQITGCVDDPNPVGASSLPGSDSPSARIDTFYATSHSSLPNLLYTSTINRFMLGKYDTYEAWACLKFFQWPDSLIGATITGATIQIRQCYNFGNPSELLSLNIYRSHAILFRDSLSVDSLSLYGSQYYDIRADSSVSVLSGDSVYNVNLYTSIVQEWFSTNSDTANYGLVFRPTNSNAIKGFYSYYASDTSYIPKLYVSYIDTNGNTGTYTHKISISKYVSKFNSSGLDTNHINVQDGISYRGLISFDSLLTIWPVQIHRAVLQITLDSANCSTQFPFGTPFANNSLYALSVNADGKSDGASFAYSGLSTDGSGRSIIYSFEIKQITERWLTNTSIRKVALSGFFESGSFDLFTFYGSGKEKSLKPRIIMTYSIKR